VAGGALVALLVDHPRVTVVYVAGIFSVFLICWYLIAQIANGLRLREQRLQDEHDRLVQIGDQKVRGTLRATHELKAPLAAIKSYVFVMRDGYAGELPAKALAIVERIGERCDLLMERISQIIGLANLKSLERAALDFAPTDVVRVLAQEVEEAAMRGRARGVTLAWSEGSAPSATVLASEPELRAMLSNILANAVDYSHDGGAVTVSVEVAEAGEVEVCVTDRGIGIAPECIPRIYEDHFRTEAAAAHRPNGSGMGMAIVAEVVRLHDAQITVDSTVGKGTSIRVRFPRPDQGEGDGTRSVDR
jgi:signal transduction histidine kinase